MGSCVSINKKYDLLSKNLSNVLEKRYKCTCAYNCYGRSCLFYIAVCIRIYDNEFKIGTLHVLNEFRT